MSAASLNTITLIGRIGRAPEEVHAGQESFVLVQGRYLSRKYQTKDGRSHGQRQGGRDEY